jgi:hypothetical protein
MCNKELSATDNVVRHVNSLQMDENGDATFQAFTDDTELSVSRLNSCIFDKEQQLAEVRLVIANGRKLRPSHGLAELNVGKTTEMVFAESGALPLRAQIRFINKPEPDNRFHAIILLPLDDYPDPQHAADLIPVLIAKSVIKTHPGTLD